HQQRPKPKPWDGAQLRDALASKRHRSDTGRTAGRDLDDRQQAQPGTARQAQKIAQAARQEIDGDRCSFAAVR
ncbi:hypothetical protein G3N75_19485, partial [Xanthomonas hortorum pv. gardneri]